jgi:hypothetical protein
MLVSAAWRRRNDEHRACGEIGQPMRDAADEQALDHADAARAGDDQPGVDVACDLDDLVRRPTRIRGRDDL